MILHTQHYFLMAHIEKWNDVTYFRLDRITNIRLLDETATDLKSIDEYKNGIDYKRFSSSLPYMFSDKPQRITFAIDCDWIIDQIVDWFGYDFKVETRDDKTIVTLNASPNAMEYWAMQYLNYVEILSPAPLRQRLIENVKRANTKYKD